MQAAQAVQQRLLANPIDGSRQEDIDALSNAVRQNENQLARLLAFLKQDVMDRFGVHERTLIRVRTGHGLAACVARAGVHPCMWLCVRAARLYARMRQASRPSPMCWQLCVASLRALLPHGLPQCQQPQAAAGWLSPPGHC